MPYAYFNKIVVWHLLSLLVLDQSGLEGLYHFLACDVAVMTLSGTTGICMYLSMLQPDFWALIRFTLGAVRNAFPGIGRH